MAFTLLVNGAERSVDVSSENTLLKVSRERPARRKCLIFSREANSLTAR